MMTKRSVLKNIILSVSFTVIVLPLFIATASYADQVITKVTDDIFTITRGSLVNSNTTFIISDEGVLVVDTRPNPDEALKVLREIRKLTSKPIKYVINTHFHGDHVFGNQVFAEASAIIAHKNVRLFLEGKSGEDHLTLFKNMGLPGLEDTKIILPNISYQKGLDIIFGKFNLQIMHLGKGHTNSDTVIYLPDEKILIAGDLIFNGKIPFAGHAFISEWIKRIEDLEKMDADIIIPGHGDVGGREIMKAMKQYLTDLKNEVSKRVAKGKSLQEIKAEVTEVMEKYKTWEKFEGLQGNIEIAYKEFGGK